MTAEVLNHDRKHVQNGPACWVQTQSGRAFDLLAPTPAMVDFRDIAGHLSRLARFNGATADGPYSVAQHCVLGAIYFEARSMRENARYFLLHDAHEAYLGDIITPVQRALANRTGGFILREIAVLKARADAAIHAAAGLEWPEPEAVREAVKQVDISLLIAERNQLLGRPPFPWGEYENSPPLPMTGRIRLLSAPAAEALYLETLERLFPALNPRHR